jgi:hypothetical protein
MAWGDPFLIDSLKAPNKITPLLRQPPGAKGGNTGYHEALLQSLIHASPSCLPIKEIDPGFSDLRPVCTELPLAHGGVERFADNLLINPDGRLCLIECKLARNLESDREVLAQLLDYAFVLAGLSYEGLRDRVQQATKSTGDPIVDAVLGPGADPDQAEELIAGVERSLQRGEMLLLIVGDRIRPNTQRLVDLLQERVTLGFTFGLVEMPVYGAADGLGYVIQPRVLLRTEVVKRTVFVAARRGTELTVEKVEQRPAAENLSEQDFYGGLAKVDPQLPGRVRTLLRRLTDLGCEVRLLRKYNIYVDDGLGGRLSILQIAPIGTVEVWGVASRDARLGQPVGRDYMVRAAALLGGQLKDDFPNPASWNIKVDGKVAIDLQLLLAHQDEWLAAIEALRTRLLDLEKKRDGS